MNFLPTTNFSSPTLTWMSISIWISLVFLGLTIIFVFIALASSKTYLNWLLAIFTGITIAASICSGFLYDSIQADLMPQVKSNLVSNLQQKYVIDDVDYDEDDYLKLLGDHQNEKSVSAAVSAASPKSQTIIVFAKDGKKVLFLLTQDKATSEPTLSDYPYQAGTTSVADITRK